MILRKRKYVTEYLREQKKFILVINFWKYNISLRMMKSFISE